MEVGARVYVPVSVAESTISKRFDVKPSATLYPNADEIDYLQRLVKYKVCLVYKHEIFIFYIFFRFCYVLYCVSKWNKIGLTYIWKFLTLTTNLSIQWFIQPTNSNLVGKISMSICVHNSFPCLLFNFRTLLY